MNVDLVVFKDGQPLKTVSVRLPVIIGRGKDVTFTIKHPLLSRKHCEVFEERGSVQVRDFDSLNGTYVDGSKVKNTLAVNPGSQLKLGAVIMEVQYNGAASEDTIASDEATAGEAFDLGAVVTADTEVMAEATDDIPAPDDAAAAEPEALDLADFELSSPSTPPSAAMLDLGEFEVSAPSVEEGLAAQDLPSLTDLAGATPEAPNTALDIQVPAPEPAAAVDPWAGDTPKVVVDGDEDLDAFLKDLNN